MEMVLSAEFATAKSGLPSPLRSAVTTEIGVVPVAKSARPKMYCCPEALGAIKPKAPHRSNQLAEETGNVRVYRWSRFMGPLLPAVAVRMWRRSLSAERRRRGH